jgi:hypothetical protein
MTAQTAPAPFAVGDEVVFNQADSMRDVEVGDRGTVVDSFAPHVGRNVRLADGRVVNVSYVLLDLAPTDPETVAMYAEDAAAEAPETAPAAPLAAGHRITVSAPSGRVDVYLVPSENVAAYGERIIDSAVYEGATIRVDGVEVGSDPETWLAEVAAAADTSGWCSTPAHGGYDHRLRPSCVDPVTDADTTAQMLAAAREHDAHVTYSPEAAYVATHRPY